MMQNFRLSLEFWECNLCTFLTGRGQCKNARHSVMGRVNLHQKCYLWKQKDKIFLVKENVSELYSKMPEMLWLWATSFFFWRPKLWGRLKCLLNVLLILWRQTNTYKLSNCHDSIFRSCDHGLVSCDGDELGHNRWRLDGKIICPVQLTIFTVSSKLYFLFRVLISKATHFLIPFFVEMGAR